MDVGAPELLPVDDEVARQHDVARELVDRQVEAHPGRDAVNRGESETAGLEAVAALLEDVELRLDLCLGIERDGAQRPILGCEGIRIVELAVVAARGSEHEPADVPIPRGTDEVARRADVDRLRELGLTSAGRVADDRRQVDDRVDILHRASHRVGVGDIRADELELVLAPGKQQRRRGAVRKRVHAPHLVAGAQQRVHEHRADVAGRAGDQDVHAQPAARARGLEARTPRHELLGDQPDLLVGQVRIERQREDPLCERIGAR